MLGGVDAFILPFSYYTHQPVFTFETGDTLRFMVYDERKKNTVTPREVINDIAKVVDESKTDTALLCMSFMWQNIDKNGKKTDFEDKENR
jgi:arginine deiminase